MRTCLNPGHDIHWDSGAVNPALGLRECDIVLDIGLRTQGYLEDQGDEVKLIQSDNLVGEHPDLPCVVHTANQWKADLFISIHCNAFNGIARGTETLVYQLSSPAHHLATSIQRSIVSHVGTVDRGIKERPDLIVLNSTVMPAVLIETAFIDQDDDARLLTHQADAFAKAIAIGLMNYKGGSK